MFYMYHINSVFNPNSETILDTNIVYIGLLAVPKCGMKYFPSIKEFTNWLHLVTGLKLKKKNIPNEPLIWLPTAYGSIYQAASHVPENLLVLGLNFLPNEPLVRFSTAYSSLY